MTVAYRKQLDFGKIDYNDIGRRINQVTVDVELRDTDKGLELSICGNVWNNLHTDIISGGQNIDELREAMPANRLMAEVYAIWKSYHLNGMHAGTPKQEACLHDHEYDRNAHGGDYYNWALAVLKTHNLLVDNGYEYGTKWLYQPIPDDVIAKIKQW